MKVLYGRESEKLNLYSVHKHDLYMASILCAITLGLKHKMKTRLGRQISKYIKQNKTKISVNQTTKHMLQKCG